MVGSGSVDVSLHDGTLGGATAVLDDGHAGLDDRGLVGGRFWDSSLGFGRTCGRTYSKITQNMSKMFHLLTASLKPLL